MTIAAAQTRPVLPSGAWARAFGLPPLVKIAIGVAVLVGIGLLVKSIISPGPPPRCLFSCAVPPTGVPEPEGLTFTSAADGFSFEYPAGAQPVPVNGALLTGFNYNDSNNNFVGQVLVGAGDGTQSLTDLVSNEAATLGSSEISNLQPAGPMPGAEIGFQPAQGMLYTGDYTDPSGNVYPVSVGIAAVQNSLHWVYVVGIGTVTTSNPTPPVFGAIDDILDRWQWTS